MQIFISPQSVLSEFKPSGNSLLIRLTVKPLKVPNIFTNQILIGVGDITKEQVEKYAGIEAQQGRLFTKEDARKIYEAVEKHKPDEIFCACDAGISRSSAVAYSLARKYGLNNRATEIMETSRYFPNKTIVETMRLS